MPEPRPTRIRLNSVFGPEPVTSPGEALPWPEVDGWLRAATEVWVVTAARDGRPHSVPVDLIWVDGVAVFGAPPSSRRGKNIEANREIVLHLPATDNVAFLEGVAEPLVRGPILDRYLELARARYGGSVWPAERLLGITWCLRPRSVIAWKVGDMRNTATRWSFS